MSRIEQALAKVAARQQETISVAKPGNLGEGETGKKTNMAALDKLLWNPEHKVDNPSLVTLVDSRNEVSEEYVKLRSMIISLTQGEQFYNTIMVTSTLGEEGKSLTALNLSIALARGFDHTVLLVDTDLRRPSLHRNLGFKPEVGLIQCLEDDLPLSDALIKTGIGKLVLLPSGGTTENPVELLSSQKMKDLVRELKNRYPERYVIFDTPPILPFADAQVLAPVVDGTIFVVREGKAKSSDVREALRSLREYNILGVVYNDVHAHAKKKHYYYYERS